MSTDTVYEFQTDTQKILKIIINSLYKEKEIFLRELLSNASDALNKVRIQKLTSDEIFEPEAELQIELIVDEDASTLTIRDTGIGMTKDELVTNLGTIAQSGTEAFLKAAEEGDKETLIGQFGVGFYSAFLVADKVEVITRSAQPDASACKWVSTGEENFAVEDAEKEHRGTDIILHIKEEDKEYLGTHRLKGLVKQYSNYIEFPIILGEDTLNDMTALWRKSPDEVEDEEYKKFYNHLGQYGEYTAKIHVRVDSPHLFYAVLYLPSIRNKMFNQADAEWGLRLYNRKILIEEHNKDVLPEYLRFIEGVVDAEDFDLNVSREVVQNTRVQRQMKNYLQKKVLSTLEKLAKDDADKYMDWYREFGAFLKEGIASNDKFKDRLIDLLRFNSNKEEGKHGAASLKSYISRMKEGQDQIFYLTGLDLDTIKASPHLEYYEKEGYEVLMLGEPIDSFLMMHLTEYDEKKFFLIDQDESEEEENEDEEKSDDESEDGEKKEKVRTGPFANLLNYFADTLDGKVTDVKTSERLVSAVARLVTPKGGMSSDLQRAMKLMETQSGTPMHLPMMGKVLQINPEHELIKKMNEMIEQDAENPLLKLLVLQIHDNARIADGDAPDFNDMVKRSEEIMQFAVKN